MTWHKGYFKIRRPLGDYQGLNVLNLRTEFLVIIHGVFRVSLELVRIARTMICCVGLCSAVIAGSSSKRLNIDVSPRTNLTCALSQPRQGIIFDRITRLTNRIYED